MLRFVGGEPEIAKETWPPGVTVSLFAFRIVSSPLVCRTLIDSVEHGRTFWKVDWLDRTAERVMS